MYAEVQKNLETLKYIEASSMPSFSIIDSPYSPIKPLKKSKIFFGVGFFFLLAFLYFTFLIGKIKLSKFID
jgi:uncharacterized protein involved in exopolysaccharide biosynthesis